MDAHIKITIFITLKSFPLLYKALTSHDAQDGWCWWWYYWYCWWLCWYLLVRMPRMVLMMVLFPLLSLLLAAWMTIFGFYLRLEEKQWQRYCDSSTSNLSFIKYVFNKNLFFPGTLSFLLRLCLLHFFFMWGSAGKRRKLIWRSFWPANGWEFNFYLTVFDICNCKWH